MKPHLIKVAGQFINLTLMERIVCCADGHLMVIMLSGDEVPLSGDDARRFGDVVRNLAAADLDHAAQAQAERAA